MMDSPAPPTGPTNGGGQRFGESVRAIASDALQVPARRTARRYAAAALAWLVAFAVTLAIAPAIQRANFVVFWIAILFAASYAGLGAAVIGAVAAVLAVDFFFLPPRYTLTPADSSDLLTLVIFVLAAGGVSALTARAAAARRDVEGRARELRLLADRLAEQQDELEAQAAEAEALMEETETANQELAEANGALAQSEARARTLQRVTASLATALSAREVANVVANAGIASGAVRSYIAVLTDDRSAIEVVGTAGFPSELAQDWQRVSLDRRSPVADAAAGEIVLLPTAQAARERYPALSPVFDMLRVNAAASFPLTADGRTFGSMNLAFETPQPFDIDDVGFFAAIAQQCAQAMDRARLFAGERAARREAEEARVRAETANRAKMDFLTTMSHELRTPLNAIAGYAELMEMGIRGPITAEQREDLSRIRGSQRHLLGLINDVLNFAKLDAGKVEYTLRDITLHDTVRTVEELVGPQFAAGGIDYVHDGCPDAIIVRADAEKVRQILLNVFSNAAKYTASGGRVEVACGARDSTATVTVRDTGLGIDPSKLDHIFEPFVQLGRSLTSRTEGTGLGLAISRQLARAMRGDLTVESEPGVGSSFRLELPLASRL